MKKILLSLMFILIFIAVLIIFIFSKRDVQALKLTAFPLNQTSIKLKWNGHKGDFVLYRSLTKASNFIKIGETTLTSYVDKNLTANTPYYYQVKKENSNFEISNIASATTFEKVPKAPVLSITPLSAKEDVFLSWKESSTTSLDGFILYRKQNGNAYFTPIATLTCSKMKYVDNALKPNMEYFYRIKAYNNGGSSKWSNIVSIKIPYAIAGYIIGTHDKAISNVIVSFDRKNSKYEFVKSDLNGHWLKEGLRGIVRIRAHKSKWRFIPEDVIVSGEKKDVDFYGINVSKKEGTLRWKFEAKGGIPTSAAIGLNGTIYVKSQDNYLYAINPNGTLKWKFKTGYWVSFDPVVSSKGTIYAVSRHGYLLAINSNSKLKWEFETGSKIESSPAVDTNGIIYVGSGDYLYAIDSNGKLKWKFETGSKIESSPAIGSNGTVYFGSNDGYLYAVSPDGELKWKFEIGWDVLSSPAIGPNGTIYVGSDEGYLYSISQNGKLKWKIEMGHFPIYNPAIGSNDVIYVGGGNNLYALNPNGTLKWKFEAKYYVSGPTVGLETVYIGSEDGNLYAIASDSDGLANSPWPTTQHDIKHTGASNYRREINFIN